MEFEFSSRIADAQYHIRGYHNRLLHNETVNERPHMHYFMEFHCVFSGEETITLPEREQQILLLPGQILLLPPQLYHSVSTPESTTVDRLCFNLSIEAAPDSTDIALRLYRQLKEAVTFEDPVANQLVQQCRNLRQQTPSAFMNRRQGTLLLSAAFQLMSNLADNTASQDNPISRSVRQKWTIEQYIESHFTENDGLSGLAQELYLSQRQTRKLVQRFMGEDYKTIIIRRRMELAEIFLRDTDKSLEEIAWQVGYRSYSGFQLSFKRYFGILPSQLRQQLLRDACSIHSATNEKGEIT